MRTISSEGASSDFELVLQSLELVSDPVVVLDALNATIVHCNLPALDLFKSTLEEIKGRSLFKLLTNVIEEEAKSSISDLTSGLRDSVVLDAQLSLPESDRTLTLRLSLVIYKFDSKDYVIATIGDITPVKDYSDIPDNIASKLGSVIELSHDAIFLIREDSILDCNNAALKTFGFDSKEDMFGAWGIRSVPVGKPGHPDPRSMRDEQRKIAVEEGTSSHESMRRKKDGTEFPVEIQYIRPDPEDPTFLLGIVRDVTARVEQERQLKLFRAAMDGAGDALFIVDTETDTIIDVNNTACEWLGYTREELKGIAPSEIVPEEDETSIRKVHQEALVNTSGPLIFESVNRRKDGSMFPVEVSMQPLTTEGRSIIVASVRDITSRKEHEQALKLLLTAIDNAGDGLFVLDVETTFVLFANKTTCNRLGYTLDELKALKAEAIEPKMTIERVKALRDAIAQSPDGHMVIETTNSRKDGSTYPCEIVFRLMQDNDMVLVGAARDMTQRKKDEEEMKRFKAAIDSTGDGLYIFDAAAGHFLFANKTACDRLGYTHDELKTMHPFDLNHETTPESLRGMQKAMAERNEDQVVFDTNHYRKDGTSYPVEMVLRVMKDDKSIIVGSERDLTQRNEEEVENRRMKAAMDGSGDMIFIVDTVTGQFIKANKTTVKTLGYSLEELQRDGINLIDVDKAQGGPEEVFRAVLESPDQKLVFQTRLERKDGSLLDAEVLVTIFPPEEQKQLVASVRDVTERVQTEVQNTRFRAAMDSTVDCLFLLEDEGNRFIDINKRTCDLLGYSREELLKLGPVDVDPTMGPEKVGGMYKMLLETPEMSDVFESELIRKDGTTFPVEISLIPIVGAGDPVVLATARDITEQKFNASQLEAARDDAERANNAKSEFLSRMSHELRTPLNAILGFAQILNDIERSEEEQEYVKHILDGGEHLFGLINEVLDISRIDSGATELDFASVDVQSALQQTINLMRVIANESDVSVSLKSDTTAAGCAVNTDSRRLQQILINILSNAIKYNKKGGHVDIGWSQINDKCQIKIIDTGRGIASADMDRLFIPFDRLGAESLGIDGVGLGLALSSKLVTAMGGTIDFESTVGVGTSVSIALPLAVKSDRDQTPHDELLQGEIKAASYTKTVLLVEDNDSNIQLIRKVIETKTNWNLEACETGEDALEQMKIRQPDLVLLDINLPNMSGIDLLKIIRSEKSTTHIPVVMLSAIADSDSIDQALVLGANHYLTKPVNIIDLIQTVNTLLL